MRKPKQKKVKPPDPVIVWRFADGNVSQTLQEYEAQRQEETARMLASDDARIRAMGKKRLAQSASAAASHKANDLRARARNATSAKKPRPSRVDPIRKKIMTAMRSSKVHGSSFRAFMQTWRKQKISGISLNELSTDSGTFKVDDENVSQDSERKYTRATLQKLYSKS